MRLARFCCQPSLNKVFHLKNGHLWRYICILVIIIQWLDGFIFNLQSWETRYVLLLWLSIVCMVPFDMSKFDGNLDRSERPIVERILDAAKVRL